jgi:hypothetical protein
MKHGRHQSIFGDSRGKGSSSKVWPPSTTRDWPVMNRLLDWRRIGRHGDVFDLAERRAPWGMQLCMAARAASPKLAMFP